MPEIHIHVHKPMAALLKSTAKVGDSSREEQAHQQAARSQSVDPRNGWAHPQTFTVKGTRYSVIFDGKFFRAGMMRSSTLEGLLGLIERKVKDSRFVTKKDIRLPEDKELGNWSGKILPIGSIVYKEGPGYRPWFHKGAARILIPKDLISTADAKDAVTYYGGTELDMYSKQFRPVVDDGNRKVWIGTQLFKTQAEALAFAKKKAAEANAKTKDAGGLEDMDANDIAEKYGFTFLAKVNKEGQAKAPDGKTIRKAGSRYTTDAEPLPTIVAAESSTSSGGTKRVWHVKAPDGYIYDTFSRRMDAEHYLNQFKKARENKAKDAGPEISTTFEKKKGYYEIKLPNGRTVKGWPLSKFISMMESEGWVNVRREDGGTVTFRSKDKAWDARSKAQVETELDKVTEEIEKYEDRGLTVPMALRTKQAALQKEYKAVVEAAKRDFKDSKPSCCKACADAKK